MAIAGKVAITLSTENGGAWSADVTYDRLVAVKHNNNLYISRKTVANVEPPNNEFWFLALEGFSGEDVEDIIDGTTQVGNAKTLDGHGAEDFAKGTDLANYLPLTGGTQSIISRKTNTPLSINNDADGATTAYLAYQINGAMLGRYGFSGVDKPVFKTASGTDRELLHTGNKPTGTYTGNGDATERRISVGGQANGVLIETVSTGGFVILDYHGGVQKASSGTDVTGVPWEDAQFDLTNKEIVLRTTNSLLNADGVRYRYHSL